MKKPVIKTTTRSGKPSICEWELAATFKTKEQCAAFIAKVFAQELNVMPAFSFIEEEIGGVPTYTVRLDYTWAHNLVTFAGLLEEVDHEPV